MGRENAPTDLQQTLVIHETVPAVLPRALMNHPTRATVLGQKRMVHERPGTRVEPWGMDGQAAGLDGETGNRLDIPGVDGPAVWSSIPSVRPAGQSGWSMKGQGQGRALGDWTVKPRG